MHPKTFFETSAIHSHAGKCFVLMPFAQNFNEVYETIREVIQGSNLGFSCVRADDIIGGGHIINDIMRGDWRVRNCDCRLDRAEFQCFLRAWNCSHGQGCQ
jgi:hypothetical protein